MSRPIPTALLALILAAAPLAAAAEEVTVFAAASLKTALDKIAGPWGAATGNTVTLSYAGSPQLAQQITAGAPADVYISAAPDWMDRLQAGGLIGPASRRDLLGNSLVIVAPAAEAAPLDLAAEPLLDRLGAEGKLAMALVGSVPAGVYGKQSLTSLGLWDAVAPSVAEAENVRAALALVARGEAPLGVVYASDAVAEPDVAVVASLPQDSHDPITYPAALVTQPEPKPAAQAFLDALSTPEARGVFEAEGFTILSP